jgi:hypothetical protein
LISYAIDLGVEVVPQTHGPDSSLVGAQIHKGVMQKRYKVRQSKDYTIKNRSKDSRVVLVEHPYVTGWNLVGPERAAERTRDAYRFEVKAEPGKPNLLRVIEESVNVENFSITSASDEAIKLLLSNGILSDKVRSGLEHIVAFRSKVAETSAATRAEEETLNSIGKDQARMRANMERVPQTSEAYKRYLKKFDDQETEIERRQAQLAKLKAALADLYQEYHAFAGNLSAE